MEGSQSAPTTNQQQATAEQTLVEASSDTLFRIGPHRPHVPGTKMVASKNYARNTRFSGITTTASGKLAVASEMGYIRLYDSIGKNARTALPSQGDPILAIDVTADSRPDPGDNQDLPLFDRHPHWRGPGSV